MLNSLPSAAQGFVSVFKSRPNRFLESGKDTSADNVPYARTLYAGWGDMDFNAHMNNKSYLDKVADVRLMYLMENGFPMEEFRRLGIGPVVLRDELEYFKEINLQQKMTITYTLAGHSADGSRYRLRNEVYRSDGRLAARVTSTGGYLRLAARRLVAPPPELFAVIDKLKRSSDFEVLPSSVRSGA